MNVSDQLGCEFYWVATLMTVWLQSNENVFTVHKKIGFHALLHCPHFLCPGSSQNYGVISTKWQIKWPHSIIECTQSARVPREHPRLSCCVFLWMFLISISHISWRVISVDTHPCSVLRAMVLTYFSFFHFRELQNLWVQCSISFT